MFGFVLKWNIYVMPQQIVSSRVNRVISFASFLLLKASVQLGFVISDNLLILVCLALIC